MNASRRTWSLWIAAVFVTLASATGCASYANIEISKSYPVGNHPTPECLDAAKRATYWCESGVTTSSPEVQSNCSQARWDHARAC
jgi:hypothetical protein